MGKRYDVTPHPLGGWQVMAQNGLRASLRTSTQKEAIAKAVEMAKNQRGEVRIAGRDGKMRQRLCYR